MLPLVHPQHQEIIYIAKFNEWREKRLQSTKNLEKLPLDELIQEVFAKKLDHFIKKLFNLGGTQERYQTDCVINFNILCRLLCKKEKSADMLFASRITYSFVHTIRTISLAFNNLFTGAILCNTDLRTLRELACDEKNQKEHEDYINSEFNSIKRAFDKHLETHLNSCEDISKQSIQKMALTYNFNAVVVEKLMQDLSEGLKEICRTCSRVFYLTIVISDFQDRRRFTATSVWHAFTIEQYDSGSQEPSAEDRCRYHIYQSWVGRASIVNDIQEKKRAGNWVLTHDYMVKQFLPTLMSILSYDEAKSSNISDLCKSIFGYIPEFKFPQSTWLVESSSTISGYALRYSYDTINPQKVSKRLIDILNNEMAIS